MPVCANHQTQGDDKALFSETENWREAEDEQEDEKEEERQGREGG